MIDKTTATLAMDAVVAMVKYKNEPTQENRTSAIDYIAKYWEKDTHREGTLRNCDYINQFQDGKGNKSHDRHLLIEFYLSKQKESENERDV